MRSGFFGLLLAMCLVFPVEGVAEEAVLSGMPGVDAGPSAAEILALEKTVAADGTQEDYRALALACRRSFRIEEAGQTYERLVQLWPTAENYLVYLRYLNAFALSEKAEELLGRALTEFPDDPALLEEGAVLAAARGEDTQAVEWIRKSWAAGADRGAWLDNPGLRSRRGQDPYSRLLDPEILVARALREAGSEKADLLVLLADVITPAQMDAVKRILLESDDSEVLRSGLFALAALGMDALDVFRDLLAVGNAKQRRYVLMELEKYSGSGVLRVLQDYLPAEDYPGNADLAEVMIARLEARGMSDIDAVARLEAIAPQNTYRYLALYDLAGIARRQGHLEEAARLHEEASSEHPAIKSGGRGSSGEGLKEYWECMERTDIQEILEILHHHRWVEPIDARIYGLPEHDFDDQQNLSIAERVFLRSWAKEKGLKWPTEGQIQYPREIRHTLRRILEESGRAIDCSGLLENLPAGRIMETNSETKTFDDGDTDNEVNVVVNPVNETTVIPLREWKPIAPRTGERRGLMGRLREVAPVIPCPSTTARRCSITAGLKVPRRSRWPIPPMTGRLSRPVRQVLKTAAWIARMSLSTPSPGMAETGDPVRVSTRSTLVTTTAGSRSSRFRPGPRHRTATAGRHGSIWPLLATPVPSVRRSPYIFSRYSTPNNGIYYSLSTNCGGSLSNPTLIASLNNGGDFEWGIPCACSRKAYIYPQADSDRQVLSEYRNNIYVVWDDLSSTCTAATTRPAGTGVSSI